MWANNRTRKIALAGILLAISTICVYLTNVLPTSRLAMLALASFLSGVLIKESGLKIGLGFTLGSIAMAFLVLAGRPIFILFAVIFAPYGLVRAIIEKVNQKFFKIFLKFAYFNLVYFFFLNLFLTLIFNIDGLKRLLGLADGDLLLYIVLFVAGNLAFFVYDYVYELVLKFYQERISRIVNK